MPILGGLNDVKDLLETMIVDSSSSLSADNVTSDSDKINDYIMADNLPFVVIEMVGTTQRNVYGRRTPLAGVFEERPFTITLFHFPSTGSGEKRFKNLFNIIDDILDYLNKERMSFQSDGIIDIYDLSSRESSVGGAGIKLVRCIIKGNLLVLRTDPRGAGFPYILPYELA